jgi:hypothetical protein
MDINTSAVSGTITTGGNHSQLEEFLSTLNVPPMSNKTFIKYEDKVRQGLIDTAAEEMKKAAEEGGGTFSCRRHRLTIFSLTPAASLHL